MIFVARGSSRSRGALGDREREHVVVRKPSPPHEAEQVARPHHVAQSAA
jgi:hypothetical protein